MDTASTDRGSLGFRIDGGDLAVDPASGEISLPSTAFGTALTLIVTARDGAGTATGRWRVAITSAALTEEAAGTPVVRRAPTLSGLPGPVLPGTLLTLDPGDWEGTPTPVCSVAWLRDGVVIAGETGLSYRTVQADDGKGLSARVTATNAVGSASAVTGVLPIRRVAPVVVGTLADQTLVQGGAAASVAVGATFRGEALALAVSGGGAVLDAATGRISLPSAALRLAEPVTMTATNSGGQVAATFRVNVAPTLLAPVATGALPAVVWPVWPGTRTVSVQAGFSGAALAYAIEAAPAGSTIDAVTGLLAIPTETAFEAAVVRVRASNAAGSAVQSFAVSTRLVATAFDTAAALAEMTFLSQVRAPAWTLDAGGFARLVPFSDGATHGVWSRSAGDGRYRALVRWTATSTVDRPFSLSARLTRTGVNFTGLRLDAYVSDGVTRLDLRQYTGSTVATTQCAITQVALTGESWTWVELELDGTRVRARAYGEAVTAPDWHLVGTTDVAAGGSVGIGGFGRYGLSPQIDLRRLEYRSPVAAPLAADAGEWSLEQWVESQA